MYREQGFLPEAIVNYLGILGYTPPEGKEIISRDELVQVFDLAKVH